ncbi:MAG TPA: TIGR03435 family protein [Bryobacteraceae bacterium]|nr:TIGR03435 family protein [Bryobacteraceae bacterium]
MRLAIWMVFASVAWGQTFDVATVKPIAPPTGGGRGVIRIGPPTGGPGSKDPGRIHYPFTNLKTLLQNAYDVKDFQISGPAWLSTERFDIQATMPPETTKEQFCVMLQNLLAERFKVTVHRETKELPMYSLIVTKNGPKLKESPPETPVAAPVDGDDVPKAPPPPLPGPGQMKFDAEGFPILPLPVGGGRGGIFQMMMPGRSRLIAQRQTMQDLAERLSSALTKPVTDATGLKAKYDFTLTFSPEGLNSGMFGGAPPPPPPGGGGRSLENMPDVEPPQDLFSAIQAQLGLKLDPKKGPVELIVVDKAEKTPTEN